MSLYDGIEVETAPIPPINIQQAMEVDHGDKEMSSLPSVPSSSTTESNSKRSRDVV